MKKYDIFISYRRNLGAETAKHLRDVLQAKGYRVFFDTDTLSSGNFNTELLRVIEECSDFSFSISLNHTYFQYCRYFLSQIENKERSAEEYLPLPPAPARLSFDSMDINLRMSSVYNLLSLRVKLHLMGLDYRSKEEAGGMALKSNEAWWYLNRCGQDIVLRKEG